MTKTLPSPPVFSSLALLPPKKNSPEVKKKKKGDRTASREKEKHPARNFSPPHRPFPSSQGPQHSLHHATAALFTSHFPLSRSFSLPFSLPGWLLPLSKTLAHVHRPPNSPISELAANHLCTAQGRDQRRKKSTTRRPAASAHPTQPLQHSRVCLVAGMLSIATC